MGGGLARQRGRSELCGQRFRACAKALRWEREWAEKSGVARTADKGEGNVRYSWRSRRGPGVSILNALGSHGGYPAGGVLWSDGHSPITCPYRG